MIYTFGHTWQSLINNYIIIPGWGLRIVSSQNFFNSSNVKEISARYYRNAVPSMNKERSTKAANLKEINLMPSFACLILIFFLVI